jgi:exosortase/archaeosortase family protein
LKPAHLSYDLQAPGAKKAILFFFIRLAIAFGAWYFIAGNFLRPARIIDQPLTNFITLTVVKTINFLSPNAASLSWSKNYNKPGNNLVQNKKPVLGIYDSCNSIDLIFTYTIVLLLLPGSVKRKLLFSIGGVIVITAVNIVRIIALYYIYQYQKEAFVFSHEYLFTILMDILIFCGWLIFIKKTATA